MSLDEMVLALESAYSDVLVAIVLYGSTAGAGVRSARSDQNLLVVLERVDLAHAEAAASAVARWVNSGNPPPLTFTRDEWRTSGDIFPMEYADVIESHRILRGQLDMQHLSVSMDHLRLQLEQEAMGKLLWMRQGAAVAGARHEARVELLEGAFSKLMVVLRGLLRLHGQPPPADRSELISHAARLATFDSTAFVRIHDAIARNNAITARESASVLAGVLSALEIVVSHINAFRPASPVYNATSREAQ
jgi:hypothetical protein